jgi:hypothetical protein
MPNRLGYRVWCIPVLVHQIEGAHLVRVETPRSVRRGEPLLSRQGDSQTGGLEAHSLEGEVTNGYLGMGPVLTGGPSDCRLEETTGLLVVLRQAGEDGDLLVEENLPCTTVKVVALTSEFEERLQGSRGYHAPSLPSS